MNNARVVLNNTRMLLWCYRYIPNSVHRLSVKTRISKHETQRRSLPETHRGCLVAVVVPIRVSYGLSIRNTQFYGSPLTSCRTSPNRWGPKNGRRTRVVSTRLENNDANIARRSRTRASATCEADAHRLDPCTSTLPPLRFQTAPPVAVFLQPL